jgi:hypothetical protein
MSCGKNFRDLNILPLTGMYISDIILHMKLYIYIEREGECV